MSLGAQLCSYRSIVFFRLVVLPEEGFSCVVYAYDESSIYAHTSAAVLGPELCLCSTDTIDILLCLFLYIVCQVIDIYGDFSVA